MFRLGLCKWADGCVSVFSKVLCELVIDFDRNMATWNLCFIVVCLDRSSVVSSLLPRSLSFPPVAVAVNTLVFSMSGMQSRYAFSLACVTPCQWTPLTFLPPVCARTGSWSSGIMFQVDRCSPSPTISGSPVFISPPFYFLFFFSCFFFFLQPVKSV